MDQKQNSFVHKLTQTKEIHSVIYIKFLEVLIKGKTECSMRIDFSTKPKRCKTNPKKQNLVKTTLKGLISASLSINIVRRWILFKVTVSGIPWVPEEFFFLLSAAKFSDEAAIVAGRASFFFPLATPQSRLRRSISPQTTENPLWHPGYFWKCQN